MTLIASKITIKLTTRDRINNGFYVFLNTVLNLRIERLMHFYDRVV